MRFMHLRVTMDIYLELIMLKSILKFFLLVSLILVANVYAEEAAKPKNNKPVLVLLHPFPTDHRLYEPQSNDLKKNFNVIAVDLKGFGKGNSTDGQAITMAAYAQDVKKQLDAQHIQKAIIGGESMGGYVALEFINQYPDQVVGLILSDTQTIADTDETKAKREAMAKDVLANGTKKMINDILPKALSPKADKHVIAYLKAIMQDQSATAVASGLRGMAMRNDTSNVLSGAKIPVLILTGDKDTLISVDQSKKMHALLKDSKLVIIANAGHLSSLEQPGKWNQAVRDMFVKN